MPKFTDRVFGANVDQKTIKIFNAMQKGQYQFEPGESVTNLEEYSKYLGEKITFARMWTAVATSGSGFNNDVFYYSMNNNMDSDYQPNSPIESGNRLKESTTNPLIKPNSGITSISSKTEGALGSILRTNVEFVVHNKNDFDNIYLPFFLRPGASVIVDFGWGDSSFNLYDIDEQLKNTDVDLSQFKKYIYDGAASGPDGEQIFTDDTGNRYYQKKSDGVRVDIKEDDQLTPAGFLHTNKGLVNTHIGVVTSYNSKVNQNGSFECSLELISQNGSILDQAITSDNNLKFIFANRFEDILIETLTGAGNENALKDYDALSTEEKKENQNLFFSSLQGGLDQDGIYGPTALQTGVISEKSAQLGIYYEQTNSKLDALYISFGVLTDLFLNSFIAKNKNNTTKYETNFKLDNYYIRRDENLYIRQKSSLSGTEGLPVFLYPQKAITDKDGKAKGTQDAGTSEQQQDGKNPYKTPIIPLRELFISVPVIKMAFQQKQNVNDAINFILNKINNDSYGVYDLRMVSPNESFSEIGFQDKNLLPPIPSNSSNFLTFDVTSGDGIVINMDYSFATPKGDLQNMLSIANTSSQNVFDVNSLDNLNFLNILKNEKYEGKDVFIRSLPIISLEDSSDKLDTKDIDTRIPKAYFKEAIDDLSITNNIKTNWDRLVSDLTVIKDKIEKKGKTKTKKPETSKVTKKNLLKADSVRDYWGKKAKKNTLLESGEETISPILPVNLTLTVYGNNHLHIGDLFTINFLPKSYMEKVFFQISNVEHKLQPNGWETTYSTFYRIRPTSKKELIDKVTVELTPAAVEGIFNPIEGEDNESLKAPEPIDIKYPGWFGFKRFLKKGDGGKSLTNKLNLAKVKTIDHVKMAYAFTSVILYYLKQLKELKPEYTVYFNIKRTTKKIDYDTLLGKADVVIDVDVDFGENTLFDRRGTLFQRYYDIQSGDNDGLLGDDDKDRVKAIFKQKAKEQVYEDFINKDLTPQENKEAGIYSNLKIDKDYAPIISGVRFKETLSKTDFISYYELQEKNAPAPYLKDFLNEAKLKLPNWFLGDDVPAFFLSRFMTGITGIDNLSTFVKNREDFKSTPPNPGYPFTGDNYNKAPFGTNESAEEARTKLAKKYDFNEYGGEYGYSKAFSSIERKRNWDASPEIW